MIQELGNQPAIMASQHKPDHMIAICNLHCWLLKSRVNGETGWPHWICLSMATGTAGSAIVIWCSCTNAVPIIIGKPTLVNNWSEIFKFLCDSNLVCEKEDDSGWQSRVRPWQLNLLRVFIEGFVRNLLKIYVYSIYWFTQLDISLSLFHTLSLQIYY